MTEDKLIEQRESLHVLLRVARHHYRGISDALSLGDVEEAQKRLNYMIQDFDKTWKKVSKMRRKSEAI